MMSNEQNKIKIDLAMLLKMNRDDSQFNKNYHKEP